ncbi:MAG TPA: DUF3566 domain-containing protein [Marmoricola sp.]|nr:DUF3566 domain-containing protein [Marmoricola sp.]
MADRRAEDAPVAPRRTLASPENADRPVLPPLPEALKSKPRQSGPTDSGDGAATGATGAGGGKDASGPGAVQKAVEKVRAAATTRPQPRRSERSERPPRPLAPASRGAQRRSIRKARLRLVQVDAWSVMKTAFLLSIAIGIITVVAVAVVWGVLGAAGVWDSIDSMVQQTLGSDNSTPFHIQDYIGTSRVLGFTMIVAVVDVILITAIATLGAFVYNLAATLVGGIEVTLAEDL